VDLEANLESIADLVALMRREGVLYLKAGEIEVTLGPAPIADEPPKAQFVHDETPPAAGEPTRSRRNKLLDHPSLKRG
jgi:hypothetical protein